MSAKRIAITGGIAEGKSTVLGYAAELGYRVASADDLARMAFQRPDTQAALAGVLNQPTPLAPETVRAALANAESRRKINAITHPLILASLKECDAQIVEVPLLIEACLQAAFDQVWVVSCGEEEQLRRLTARLGEVEARQLIAAQLPSRAKTAFADRIIRTNATEPDVKRVVSAALIAELD